MPERASRFVAASEIKAIFGASANFTVRLRDRAGRVIDEPVA
jgi:hypothetical protein